MKKLTNISEFFEKIANEQDLILPIEKAGKVNFGKWTKDARVRLDILKTVKSAKDAFFPQVENMMNFHLEGKNIQMDSPTLLEKDFVLFGVKPCDYRSFELLDKVFLTEPVDPYYEARRKHATVITLACNEPETSCFCTNFDIKPEAPIGDISCWLIDDTFCLKANSEKGEKLISYLEDDEKAEEIIAKKQEEIKAILERLPLKNLNLKGFDGEHLMEKFNSPKWKDLSRACLGCGACTFTCPTCQCYDIKDFDSGKGIVRYRCWDSCMYSDFTLMAAATNRPTQLERFRQRFMHKLVYFPSNNEGIYSCVGCGRCIDTCPQSLNIVKIIRALGDAENE